MRENDLIAALRARVGSDPTGMTGIGDDCALWTPGGPSCISVDTLVEGRHFAPGTALALVGRKAAAAAISDLAAMGALPRGALAAACLPQDCAATELMEGLIAELERHGCPLLGGDTVAADQLMISITVWGEAGPAGRFLRRDGAQLGDLLVVTGKLGGSLASGRHLRPEPRLAEGRWLAGIEAVHAAMDLSDGLATDAPRLAAASGLGCVLLAQDLPVHPDVPAMADGARAALGDGEDFELLLAVAAPRWPDLQLAWPFALELSLVGSLVAQAGAWIEDHRGRLQPLSAQGFQHRW